MKKSPDAARRQGFSENAAGCAGEGKTTENQSGRQEDHTRERRSHVAADGTTVRAALTAEDARVLSDFALAEGHADRAALIEASQALALPVQFVEPGGESFAPRWSRGVTVITDPPIAGGVQAFDRDSLVACATGAGVVLVITGDRPPALYAALAVRAALDRAGVLIVESISGREAEWLQAIYAISPSVELLLRPADMAAEAGMYRH